MNLNKFDCSAPPSHNSVNKFLTCGLTCIIWIFIWIWTFGTFIGKYDKPWSSGDVPGFGLIIFTLEPGLNVHIIINNCGSQQNFQLSWTHLYICKCKDKSKYETVVCLNKSRSILFWEDTYLVRAAEKKVFLMLLRAM